MKRVKKNIIHIPKGYKPIMLIDKKGMKNEYDKLKSKEHAELVKSYIKYADYKGLKKVSKFKLIEFYHLKKIKKFIQNIKDVNKYLGGPKVFGKVGATIFGSIAAYYFYLIGYGFLYAYSFPVDAESISLLEIFVDQVPFNFKLNVAVGIVFILVFLSIAIPLFNIFVLEKDILINWIISAVESIIYTNILSGIFNVDSIDEKVILGILIGLIPIVLFAEIYALSNLPKESIGNMIIVILSSIFIGIISLILINCVLKKFIGFGLTIEYSIITFLISLALMTYVLKNRRKVKEEVKHKNDSYFSSWMIGLCFAGIVFLGYITLDLTVKVGIIASDSSRSNKEREIIYKDENGKHTSVNGTIVTEKDGNYYISVDNFYNIQDSDDKKKGRGLLIINQKDIIQIYKSDKKAVSFKEPSFLRMSYMQ